jgi:phage gpG-like protein
MRFTIDPAAIELAAREPAGWEDVALERKAVAVELAAKRLVNVDTGNLRASITHELDEDDTGRVAFVGSNVDYALYQELEPGDIFPSGAGKYAGAPRVRRGGQPYLRPALYGAGS